MADARTRWSPTLERADDPVAAASVALVDALSATLAERDEARLAIPGGSALAALPRTRERLGGAWKRVALTWLDERCVPESDPESNHGAARRLALLSSPSPLHCVPLYLDGETPEEAVARVSLALRRDFGGCLDVLLLGMGEDGHVGSLFPSRPPPGPELVAHVPDSPKPPASRITLTRPLLATAARGVLLVTGEAKRGALERLLAGDEALPAYGLSGLRIVTDLDVGDVPPAENAGTMGAASPGGSTT